MCLESCSILLLTIVSRCVGNCQQMCRQLSADVSAIVSRCVGNCQQTCRQLSAIIKKYFLSPFAVRSTSEKHPSDTHVAKTSGKQKACFGNMCAGR